MGHLRFNWGKGFVGLVRWALLSGCVAGPLALASCGGTETEPTSTESEAVMHPPEASSERPPVLGAEPPTGECQEDSDCSPDDQCIPDGCAVRDENEPIVECEESGPPIGACTCFEGECQEVAHDAPGGRDEVRAGLNLQ